MSSIRIFLRNRFFSIGTLLALLANAALWIFLAQHVTRQEEHIALHYNIYFGIDLVGPWWYSYFLPAIGSAVLIVNLSLSFILQRREAIIAYFLTSASVLVQILFFLAGYLAITQV